MGGAKPSTVLITAFSGALFWFSPAAFAQDSRPESAPAETRPTVVDLGRLIADLGSPYQAERREAVRALIGARADESALLDGIADRPGRVRAGIAEALIELGTAKRLRTIADLATGDADLAVRERFGEALFAIACREGPAGAGVVSAVRPGDPALLNAAEAYVRREIGRLVRLNAEWTYFRPLARFFWMGAYAEPALLRVLADKEAPSPVHCLAATALGRVESQGFWTTPTGEVSESFKAALKDAGEDARMALVYAASAAGVSSPAFIAEIARYTREDAFNAMQIEAGLYFLAALTDAQIAAAREKVTDCAREFTHGYDERVLWNGGIVLGRLKDPALARERIADMKESKTFGGYALFDAIVTNLAVLPKDEADPLIRDLCTWGLGQEVPQIRGLAYLTWRRRFGGPPEGADLGTIVRDIVQSTRKIHGQDADQDGYAQRTGITILGKLEAAGLDGLFKELLHFPSEAVRAAAAMAAGKAAGKITDDLLPMLAKDGEWDVFGAAFALHQIGDRRAIPAWVELLDCGNFALLPSVKSNLEQLTGDRLDGPAPVIAKDWRDLAVWWRRHTKP